MSQGSAQRNLRAVSDAGSLRPQGETKARRYAPGPELAALRQQARMSRPLRDPYEVVTGAGPAHAALPL